MVFTVNLKWISLKQDISSLITMLNNQRATYAILRYAYDIPDTAYKKAMNLLASCIEQIHHRKLYSLVKSYSNISKVGIVMDEEFVETIEVPVGLQPWFTTFIEDADDVTTSCWKLGNADDIEEVEFIVKG